MAYPTSESLRAWGQTAKGAEAEKAARDLKLIMASAEGGFLRAVVRYWIVRLRAGLARGAVGRILDAFDRKSLCEAAWSSCVSTCRSIAAAAGTKDPGMAPHVSALSEAALEQAGSLRLLASFGAVPGAEAAGVEARCRRLIAAARDPKTLADLAVVCGLRREAPSFEGESRVESEAAEEARRVGAAVLELSSTDPEAALDAWFSMRILLEADLRATRGGLVSSDVLERAIGRSRALLDAVRP